MSASNTIDAVIRFVLYTDNTLPFPVESFCRLINSVCQKITCDPGSASIHIADSFITNVTYDDLPAQVKQDATKYDDVLVCTNLPYENRYFFDPVGRIVIISFSDWNAITDLPIPNGLLYFFISMCCYLIGVDKIHYQNTGCVNDFWIDKTGVDVGMRAAFICKDCISDYAGDASILHDIKVLLDIVCRASRAEKNILDLTEPLNLADRDTFHVFLCHNSEDKPAIRKINKDLQANGIKTWLDEEQLPLGRPWQPELEKQIGNIKHACVFIGRNGIGPWQNMEVRAFLSEFISRDCSVIPVLLPDASSVPDLPIFLKSMTWTDLRHDYDLNFARLVKALRPT